MFCNRVVWVYLICLLLYKEEGSSPVSTFTERRDVGLFYMGIYIYEIDTSLLKKTLLIRYKINILYK